MVLLNVLVIVNVLVSSQTHKALIIFEQPISYV